MNPVVLWLLLGVAGIALDLRTPEASETLREQPRAYIGFLLMVLILLGPLTLAGALACALPRRNP